MSEDKFEKLNPLEAEGSSAESQVLNGHVSVIASPTEQKEFDRVIEDNPDKIEGSVGEYLIALRPGMTLNEAETAQIELEKTKIESFGIVDESGEIITAKNIPKTSFEKVLLAKNIHAPATPFVLDFNVTPSFLNQVQKDIKAIPVPHRQLLSNSGFKVELYKDINAYDLKHGTTYATDHPEGYPPGATGENLDVFFDQANKTVVAVEFFKPSATSPQTPSTILKNPGRLIHEIGHAFSMARNFDIERDPATMSLFESLRQKLNKSPVTYNAIWYFSQQPTKDSHGNVTEHFGLRETIAEFYASHYTSGADPRKHVEKSLMDLYRPIWEIMKRKGYLI